MRLIECVASKPKLHRAAGWQGGEVTRRRRRQQWPQKAEAIECGGGLVKIVETQQVRQTTSHTHTHTCKAALISSVFVLCAHCRFVSFACTHTHIHTHS